MEDRLSGNWNRVRDIVSAAAELPEAEREAFVTKRCAGEEALLAEVTSLLAQIEAEGEGPFDVPAGERAANLFERAVADPELFDLSGQSAGPYQLVRRIARGGMGDVYLAERSDREFDRRVALKFVRPDAADARLFDRFRTEEQILAGLTHPGVARLYDGGLTEAGAPYFAMEYVEGEPITTYCDERNLGVEARLELFTEVCEAVAYAQQHLVVHRDLKPGNIFVNEDGRVKLLDFGIAKVLEPGHADATQTVTRILTPVYSAPEQLIGGRISTATDVYSLGVVLYELLTGRLPYKATTDRYLDLVKAICEEEPERPSTAVAAAVERDTITTLDRSTVIRRARRLKGDLDTIVLKGLRKEPSRRYPTAEAFLDDIRRYLHGLPVKARPDTAGYRTGKFVRRHKTGVAVTVCMFVMLAGAVAGLLGQQSVVRSERDSALRESEKLDEVVSLVTEMFHPTTISELQLSNWASNVRERFSERPELRAALLHTIGHLFYRIERYAEALELYEEALTDFRQGIRHPDKEEARALYSIGDAKWRILARNVAGNYHMIEDSDWEEVDSLLAAALRISNEVGNTNVGLDALWLRAVLRGSEARDSTFEHILTHYAGRLDSKDLCKAYRQRAFSTGRFDHPWQTVEERYDAALSHCTAAFGSESPVTSSLLGAYGSILRTAGEYERAETMLLDHVRLVRAFYPEGDSRLVMALRRLSWAKAAMRDFEQAASYMDEAVEAAKAYRGPRDSGFSNVVANAIVAAARMKRLAKDFAGADSLLAVLFREYPRGRGAHENFARAWISIDVGDFVAAEQDLRIAVERRKELNYADVAPLQMAFTLASHAHALSHIGEFEQTVRVAQEAIGFGWGGSIELLAAASIGRVYAAKGRFSEAAKFYGEALEQDPEIELDTPEINTEVRNLYERWGQPIPPNLKKRLDTTIVGNRQIRELNWK